MGIQFGGLATGLPVNDIISKLIAVERQPITLMQKRRDKINTEKSQYTAVSTRVRDMNSALLKLTDARLGGAFDLFAAKLAKSSKPEQVTATATNDAVSGSYKVKVLNLASSTKAISTGDVVNYTQGNTSLNQISHGAIRTGSFTVFINNQARTINVDRDVDTAQSVMQKIADEITIVSGAAASGGIGADGKAELSYTSGTTIRFGATGDTTNFATVMHLNTGSADPSNSSFTAKHATNVMNRDGKLVGNEVGFQGNPTINTGTVKIGKASFTITADTTLTQFMNQVNSSSEANVSLTFNSITNRYELLSKEAGSAAITMDDGGTGLLDALRLTNGPDTMSSQILGNNARFTINDGPVLESASNTVDSGVSGIVGLTFNLLADTAGAEVTIDVNQDTDKLKGAVNDILIKINAAISFMDDQTKKDAVLQGESGILRFRNQIRTKMSEGINSLTTFKTLSQIGISTGAVNASPGQGSASNTFRLDDAKFMDALAQNPQEVKRLLIGDNGTDGILSMVKKVVDNALDVEYGLFTSRENSANRQIKDINDAIKRSEGRLEVREKQLRAQFTAMETMVSQLQRQQNALASLSTLSYKQS